MSNEAKYITVTSRRNFKNLSDALKAYSEISGLKIPDEYLKSKNIEELMNSAAQSQENSLDMEIIKTTDISPDYKDGGKSLFIGEDFSLDEYSENGVMENGYNVECTVTTYISIDLINCYSKDGEINPDIIETLRLPELQSLGFEVDEIYKTDESKNLIEFEEYTGSLEDLMQDCIQTNRSVKININEEYEIA